MARLYVHVVFSLLLISCFQSKAQVNVNDSLVLVSLYDSLEGPEWSRTDNWLSGPVGDWFGITVENNRVIKIRLSNNNLQGPIPSRINELDALEELILGNSLMTGPVPDLSNLQKLNHLFLYTVQLNSEFPQEIRPLNALQRLNLGISGLTGEVPDWLSELKELKHLELATNQLKGDIGSIINEMTDLRTINLFNNEFTGLLPDLSIHPNMEVITLGENAFSGPFPDWIVDLPKLKYFNVSDNDLSGELPTALFSKLNNMMFEFHIGNNDFEGDLYEILDAPMTDLNRFEIQNNNFTGGIPQDFIDASKIATWSIEGNQLVEMPDFTTREKNVLWFSTYNNKLGFEFLEKARHINSIVPGRVFLGPQQDLLEEEFILPQVGESITIQSGSGGDFSSYQWYKNDVLIADATHSEYVISNYSPSDDGVYFCIISNDSLDFDLQRNKVYVGMVSSTDDVNDKLEIHIYPQPAEHYCMIESQEARINTIRIFSSNGQQVIRKICKSNVVRLDLSELTSGQYTIQVFTDSGTAVDKILVN